MNTCINLLTVHSNKAKSKNILLHCKLRLFCSQLSWIYTSEEQYIFIMYNVLLFLYIHIILNTLLCLCLLRKKHIGFNFYVEFWAILGWRRNTYSSNSMFACVSYFLWCLKLWMVINYLSYVVSFLGVVLDVISNVWLVIMFLIDFSLILPRCLMSKHTRSWLVLSLYIIWHDLLFVFKWNSNPV